MKWFYRDWSLANKMLLIIGSAVLCTFIIVSAYTYTVSKNMLEANLDNNAKLLTQKTAGDVEAILQNVEKVPQSLSIVLSNHPLTEAEIFNLIRSYLAENKHVFGIAVAFDPKAFDNNRHYFAPYVFRDNGKISSMMLGNNEYMYEQMDWFQIPKELNKPYWTEPYYDEGGGNIVMATFSVPFYKTENGKKTFRGIVTADVSLEGLTDLIAAVKVYETGYSFITSQTGTFVVHPNKKFILNETIFSLGEEFKIPEFFIMGEKMISGKIGDAKFTYNNMRNGKLSWIYFSPIVRNGWSVGVVYPVDELFADARTFGSIALFLAIIGGVALLSIILYVSRSITKPLRVLTDAAAKLGAGNFSAEIKPLDANDEVGHLNSSFRYMQAALKEYIESLTKTTAAKEKIESELRIAHEIQMSIIPKFFPAFPERDEIDLFARLIPVKEVGGDLYDFFFIDDDHLCLAIGDVSGKGVPAALFMAVTRTLLRARIAKGLPPQKIVQIMNEDLCKDNSQRMFVTFFLGILNVTSGEFEYCNAGHNQPYLVNDGTCEELEKFHGFPLGIKSGTIYKAAKTIIKKDSLIMFYTDGITEAENAREEFYDDERLITLLKQEGHHSPQLLIEKLITDVHHFADGYEQSDDMTVLAVRYLKEAEAVEEEKRFFKYTIKVKQNVNELEKIQLELDSLFVAWKITGETINDYQLAFEELMTNIIYYAFPESDGENYITVSVNFEEDEIRTQLEDDGVAFNPLGMEDPTLPKSIHGVKPGGLGVFICKQILDKIDYQRIDNKNILTFSKLNK